MCIRYAHTGENQLGLWFPKVVFNTDYLTFESMIPDSMWMDPTFYLSKQKINEEGVVEAYSTGAKDGVSPEASTGDHLRLARYTFKVKTPGSFERRRMTTIESILILSASSLTSVNAIDFVKNQPGKFFRVKTSLLPCS